MIDLMHYRTALFLAFLSLSACSVQQREEAKTPAPSMRVSGGGFSEAVPVRKPASSRAARPYLEGNLVAQDDADVEVPEGTPYIPENPEATRLCTTPAVVNDDGTAAFPVKDRFAHLPVTGQFLTAWSCGLRRVRELPAVHGDEYVEPVHFTLNAAPAEDFEGALFMAGFSCEEETKGKGCIEWTKPDPIRIDLLARLGAFVDRIEKE